MHAKTFEKTCTNEPFKKKWQKKCDNAQNIAFKTEKFACLKKRFIGTASTKSAS